ncbi:unnamed protein product [Ectocarpus sp. 12 AP-2014]
MGETELTGFTIMRWASRLTQGLLLTMVLDQIPLTMPAPSGEISLVVQQRDGRGDEAAAKAVRQDLVRRNRLRLEENNSLRGSHELNQQRRTERKQNPNAPASSRNHHDQQGSGQEHRKVKRRAEGLPGEEPEVSLEPETPEDAESSLPTIYRTSNGSCPVIPHNSNSAVLQEDQDNAASSTTIVDGLSVWARLQQAATASSRLRCPSPRCCQGIHLHTYQGGDLGEEMSHIQGAVVVRRPDLTREPGSLAPAHDMDFVRTLQSYFTISQGSLLRRMVEADGFDLESTTVHVHPRFPTLLGVRPFLGAVREGNSAAAQLLTPYCSGEDPGQDVEDCVRIPTLVSMVDVFVNRKGAVWNEQDFIAPVNCARFAKDEAEDALLEAAGDVPRYINSYEKVFMMAQEWGPNYYHFTVEHLPRITLALDVLLENPDIMIVMHHHGHDKWHDTSAELEAHMELFELIGISRERIVYTSHEVHANLAIVPTTTNCGDPDPNMVNMLRNRFLQGLFPATDGVPPVPPRPVIVLIVRSNIRGLENNDEVKEALERNFPSFDVVEFFGTDPVRDQLKTFATAAMIIAPHGAGLANMIVAPLHTPVLEIAPLECPPCFLRLAFKLHHIYARHTAGDDWTIRCNTWYNPDVDGIIDLARDLLEAKRQADDAR